MNTTYTCSLVYCTTLLIWMKWHYIINARALCDTLIHTHAYIHIYTYRLHNHTGLWDKCSRHLVAFISVVQMTYGSWRNLEPDINEVFGYPHTRLQSPKESKEIRLIPTAGCSSLQVQITHNQQSFLMCLLDSCVYQRSC